MNKISPITSTNLIGIGLYTPAEAGRLAGVSPAKITRWLRGHETNGRRYDALWRSQADFGAEGLFLGFRDLQEIRVASAFIAKGLSPQRVRHAIRLAKEMVADDHPLSTVRFRTDGRTIFLQAIEADGSPTLIDLFKKQFVFKEIIERSLSNVDYDDAGLPALWWPLGKSRSVVLDPTRSFGQPIEVETSIPVAALVSAVTAEGSEDAVSRAWSVPVRAVRRALSFHNDVALRDAA